MREFYVEVIRYHEDKSGETLGGVFNSAVFCIDTDSGYFLVYDPGDEETREGFCWVNPEEKISNGEAIVKLIENPYNCEYGKKLKKIAGYLREAELPFPIHDDRQLLTMIQEVINE